MPEAVTELAILETENTQFTSSFVELDAPPKKPPEPTPNRRTWRWDGVVEEQPKRGQEPEDRNNTYRARGSTKRERTVSAARYAKNEVWF